MPRTRVEATTRVERTKEGMATKITIKPAEGSPAAHSLRSYVEIADAGAERTHVERRAPEPAGADELIRRHQRPASL